MPGPQISRPGRPAISLRVPAAGRPVPMYLTMVMDLFDRRVVGWAMSTTLKTEDTTIPALLMACTHRQPTPGLIFHSDRGSQYACEAFRLLLGKLEIKRQSMSRRGNCYDNAVAESFFKTLKYECTNRYDFDDQRQAARVVFEYIETWYNTHRIHRARSLGAG
ncbi:IS3 family transposase [Catalinimonas alkaloidigena]|uniref:IS3 family transposase n=1 Tax=Catalinimonas alkaloidigena TaxID=1075417 RepID=UPI003977A93B